MLIPSTITYSIADGYIREISRASIDVEPKDVANHLCAFLRQKEKPEDMNCCDGGCDTYQVLEG